MLINQHMYDMAGVRLLMSGCQVSGFDTLRMVSARNMAPFLNFTLNVRNLRMDGRYLAGTRLGNMVLMPNGRVSLRIGTHIHSYHSYFTLSFTFYLIIQISS